MSNLPEDKIAEIVATALKSCALVAQRFAELLTKNLASMNPQRSVDHNDRQKLISPPDKANQPLATSDHHRSGPTPS